MALARPARALSRRLFLRGASGAAVGLLLPDQSAASERSRAVLVCLNLVGGLDGLSVLVPYAEDAYYRSRPRTSVPPPGASGGALPLADGFGLHPSLASLYSLYLEQRLVIVPAAGGAQFNRSHFAAREALHVGHAASSNSTDQDGWANRYAQLRGETSAAGVSLFSASADLPRAFAGTAPAETAAGRRALSLSEGSAAYVEALHRLYRGANDPFARAAEGALRFAAEAREKTQAVRLSGHYDSRGHGLRDAARLIRGDVGAEIIWVDVGGFDTHKSQGGTRGRLAGSLTQLAQNLAAFRQDLGRSFADVTLVTLTEFGRTLRENGSGGTDHGSASCMLVLGGRVNGGRLAGSWPGLEQSALRDGRELAVTTDYRVVLADLLSSHLAVNPAGLARVFPDLDASQYQPLGLCARP